MMYYLYSICYFFVVQTSVTPSASEGESAASQVATTAVETGTATPPPPGIFESMALFLPAMLAVMVVYFIMMSRPQKKEAQSRERLKDLKKNDRVVTAGGILGTVVNVRPDTEYTTIRIDDSANTKMQVMTQSIVRILSDESAESGASEKSK
jgi:preprotein translocase subunit YajC